MEKENRKFGRTNFKTSEMPVEIESKKGNGVKKYCGFFKNISVGGCKVALSEAGIDNGEMVTLRFTVPDTGNIVLSGTVQSSDNNGSFIIHRIEFLKLTQERIKTIKQYFNFEM